MSSGSVLSSRRRPPTRSTTISAEALCARPGCGHPASWHRLDSSTNVAPTDPTAEFRCLGYDPTGKGRPTVCVAACPDFMDPEVYG